MNSLDRAVNSDFVVITKSLIPYLDADNQKSIAVFVKTFELLYTIDLFSREEFVRSVSVSHDTGWEKSFLKDLRTNLSDDRGSFIDTLLKLTELKDLILPLASGLSQQTRPFEETDFSISPPPANSSATPPPPNPDDIMGKFSNILEPNQLQLLKMLSSFIK